MLHILLNSFLRNLRFEVRGGEYYNNYQHFSSGMVLSSYLLVDIRNSVFLFCSSTIGGGILCVNPDASLFLIGNRFINCSATTIGTNFRNDVSGGAFVFGGKGLVADKNCFVQCRGMGKGFVFHSDTTVYGNFTLSHVNDCGLQGQGEGTVVMDHGNQYISHINSSSNKGNVYFVSGAFGTYVTGFLLSYSAIISNSLSQTILGFGTHSLPNPLPVMNLLFISNSPTVALLETFSSPVRVYDSIFINNQNGFYRANNGILYVKNCLSDSTYGGLVTIESSSSNVIGITTFHIAIDACGNIPTVSQQRPKFLYLYIYQYCV